MALYETIYIARQDLTADDVDNLSDKLAKIITDGKGKIVSKEYWGLRNMAYKINKNSRGHYVLFNIDAKKEAVAELNRVMSFNEDIIRSTTFVNEFGKFEQSELFVCANAKDYKTAAKAASTSKKEVPSKYDAVLDQVQFDN